jgi:hypothetical protein
MPTTAEEIHAAVERRFAQVARSPGQEQKIPVGYLTSSCTEGALISARKPTVA